MPLGPGPRPALLHGHVQPSAQLLPTLSITVCHDQSSSENLTFIAAICILGLIAARLGRRLQDCVPQLIITHERSYLNSSEPSPGCLLQCQQCVGRCHLSMFELYHACCVTSVSHMVAGETAAACDTLEREAVFLLCGHAAHQPSDIGLVGAALDMLAARLNYPSRSSLMCLHAQTLVFDWCSHDYSLHHFLAIQVSTAYLKVKQSCMYVERHKK